MLKFLFARGQEVQLTALGRAENAIRHKDYSALADAAHEIERLIPSHPFLVEPLVIIADHLGQNSAYIQQAVRAAQIAAHRTPYESELEQLATASWEKHNETLATQDILQAVLTARDAILGARADGYFEERAVTSILKHVDALMVKDFSLAIQAVRFADSYTFWGSDLEQQVQAKKRELESIACSNKIDIPGGLLTEFPVAKQSEPERRPVLAPTAESVARKFVKKFRLC
jgi:hypothetical protein